MKGRIKAFDLARGIAIFLMIYIHAWDTCTTLDTQDSYYALPHNMLITFMAAPIFVFVMGVFFQISNKPNIQNSINRGVKLFLFGYFLNFLRFALPTFLALQFGIFGLEDLDETPLELMRIFDIFQFAGIALVLMAIVKRYLKHPISYIVLSLVIIFVSPMLWNKLTGISYIDFFLEMFLGQNDFVNFPFFPWLSYVFLGMAYGYYMKAQKYATHVFVKSLGLGIVLLLAGGYIFIQDVTLSEFRAIHAFSMGCIEPALLLSIIGGVLVWIPTCHLITSVIPNNSIFERLYYWSLNVTPLYFIQWIIIGWISVEVNELGSFGFAFLFITILAASDRFVILWNDIKASRLKN